MKRVLMVLLVLGVFSLAAEAALITPVKLEVINSSPNLNSVLVTNETTGQNLFSCGSGSTTCSASVRPGSKIKMLAQPLNSSPHFIFEGWRNNSGSTTACNTQQGICTFTIQTDSKTTAQFHQLVVLRVGVGSGTGSMVIKNPSTGAVLFQCTNPAPTGCTSGILQDTKLRIEAVGGAGQQFANFSAQTGSATVCTGQGATFFCTFTMHDESTLFGNFIQIP